ncbi:RNA-dependent ATPase [Oleoguttula mirabilis]|uniref:RNA helicase n=1 Tax=Oleoguttula mirabilis TaxID=1507867 RepID=A0AAV9JTM4_9PEZI|nr:RNA-dependent ATPase [Oleoguttula mirabilis]
MAKRSLDDAATVDESKDARREAKRLKKEKKAKAEVVTNGAESAPVHGEGNGVEGKTGEDGGQLSKEERKALKRAKKEQAKSEATHEAAESVADATGDVDTAAKAERKALKQAEKVARKAATVSEPVTNGGAPAEKAVVNGSTSAKPDETAAYREDPALAALPQSEIDAFIAEKQLAIEDPRKQLYRPITSFKYLPVDEAQRAPFASFSAPTPIQSACWPYLFAGRDIVGVAETGSGKTLAFGVPCIRYIAGLDKKARKGIKACIVSPTRELALQIHEQLVKIAEPAGVKVTVVYGGTNKDEQRATLRGTHVVVATPGRLNDYVQEGSIDLSNVTYVVLDEADRMLDKGFEQEVRKIISATAPTGRQTLMFTATWPPSVRELADTFMTKPVKVTIGDNASGELRANVRIIQEIEVMEDQRDKQPRLIELLKQYQSGKNKNDRILVFCLYKKEATRIEEFVRRRGFNVAGIHGDLNQQKRMESLEAFKAGTVPILVATDVAARGLDIPAVKVVINVTFPLTAEDYVHRIGRTGRAGQDGRAVTFFTDAEKHLSGALINVLKAANQPVPEALMKYGTTVKKVLNANYGAFYRDPADMKKATKITFD